MSGLHPGLALLAGLVAVLCSYCTMTLVSRVRKAAGQVRARWLAGGSLVMGTGLWSQYLLGLMAWPWPVPAPYGVPALGLTWLVAVTLCATTLLHFGQARVALWRRAVLGATLSAGLGGFYLMSALTLRLQPPLAVDPSGLAVAAAAALVTATVGLSTARLYQGTRILRPAARKPLLALCLGGLGVATEFAVFASLHAAPGSMALSDGVDPGALIWPVSLGTGGLLALTLFLARVDARMQRAIGGLVRSLRAANSELERLASHDALTGLPNRSRLLDFLARSVAAAGRRRTTLALVFIGLDEFKRINDSLGHTVGDEVLKGVAERLLAAAPAGEHLLARVGSDEFVLVMGEAKQRDEALAQAGRLLAQLREPVLARGHSLTLTASAGVALCPDDAQDHQQLLSCADTAMQAAKQAGRNRVQSFLPEMQRAADTMMRLHAELRESLIEGGLRLYLQPKVDARSRCVTGAEALLRWEHPARGTLAPGLFLEAAERYGLIQDIGAWTLSEACRIAAQLQARGHAIPISVNLSARQFCEPELVALVTTSLETHGVHPSMLWLEITEGTAMEDTDRSRGVLEALRTLGVGVAIDDFGTGYSSLGYLRTLKVQEIKLDRSFIMELDEHPHHRALVEAIVRLGHAVGMRVVAEGVETEAQQRFLKTVGADELQGYLFGRPMPADELFARYLAPAMVDDRPASTAEIDIPLDPATDEGEAPKGGLR